MASLTYNTVPTSGADEESQSLLTAKTSKPRRRVVAAALVAVAFALGTTVAYVAPTKSSTSADLASSPDCEIHDGSMSCSPLGVAKAWKAFDGGAYADDCVNAMAIALGEGIQPYDPHRYIREYCVPLFGEFSCYPGPPADELGRGTGPVINLDGENGFMTDTRIFPLNQPPLTEDDPMDDTLGPWQTRTDKDVEVDDINVRIREAIGYVENCCMDGRITVRGGVPADSADLWCPYVPTPNPPALCDNIVDAECNNPLATDDDDSPDPEEHPISTILESNIEPRHLTWCGCTAAGKPTTGYSGRCSANGGGDYYTKYKDTPRELQGGSLEGLAVEICKRA